MTAAGKWKYDIHLMAKLFTVSPPGSLTQGIRVPVSKNRYRTIDSLLDDLNANIDMPFGVRRLTTPMGRTAINDIDQLEHLGNHKEVELFELLFEHIRYKILKHNCYLKNLDPFGNAGKTLILEIT
ncbi:unnamed protein product [Cylicostephanus goldi]|uniref:Doublecortin domain-containing protein n=1 Tax=Cylicostephanus goldi TaxID=71465 RepID=A0A3P7M6W4_CYLGO|nr:unnamed protein product [Cylicostephanus goldi]